MAKIILSVPPYNERVSRREIGSHRDLTEEVVPQTLSWPPLTREAVIEIISASNFITEGQISG